MLENSHAAAPFPEAQRLVTQGARVPTMIELREQDFDPTKHVYCFDEGSSCNDLSDRGVLSMAIIHRVASAEVRPPFPPPILYVIPVSRSFAVSHEKASGMCTPASRIT